MSEGNVAMLLSMWMIANRLSSFDMQIHIKNDARPVLKSPRLAYATDCVMVYPDGKDVVYIHEDDTIRIKNVSLTMGFELIQSVFDFYEEWLNTVRDNLQEGNYERIINTSWMIFHNPLVLLNGQFRVLAMSDQYVDAEMDEEWRYLSYNKYVSFDAIKTHRKNKIPTPEDSKPCYYNPEKKYVRYSSLSCVIWANKKIYGRIIVLEKDRRLNAGDAQLLSILAKELTTTLAEHKMDDDDAKHVDFFSNLLEGRDIDENCRQLILKLRNWAWNDYYCLYYLEFRERADQIMSAPLVDVLRRSFLDCIIIRKESVFFIVQNVSMIPLESIKERLKSFAQEQNMYLSVSLTFPMLNGISYLKDQALYSMKNGKEEDQEFTSGCYSFEKYATGYFVEKSSLRNIFFAVHPIALDLWIRSHTTRHNPFKTYLCYLENNRSLVRTASELFIHRNTLVYRLQKIEDHINLNSEDYRNVDYLKLSMQILELIGRRIGIASDYKTDAESFLPIVLKKLKQWEKENKNS